MENLIGIVINYEQDIENLCGYTYKDEWSRDSYNYINKITGFKTEDTKYYNHLVVPFEIKPCTPYYLVYVEYTTGDSFGRDSGNLKFIMLYNDFNQAEEVAKSIRSQEGKYSINIEMPNNEIVKISAPWTGYFEKLDSVNVETVYLEEYKISC